MKNSLFELIHQAKVASGYASHVSRIALSRNFRAKALTGVMPGSETRIKILFLGHVDNLNPMREFFFDGIAQEEDLGSFYSFFQRRARARRCSPDTDAVVSLQLPASGRPDPGSFVTTSLHAKVALPATMDQFVATLPETERRKLRQMLKAGFEVEIGNTESDYREFHERMFGPLMRDRHGQKAYVPPVEQILDQILRSSLIFIKADGKRLGGILIRWPRINGSHALPHFDKIGIINDVSRDASQLNRVNIALYYQMFNATIQRHYPILSLGVVPPLLNSGLFWFKARWGSDYSMGNHEFDYYRHIITYCSQKQHEIQCHRHLIHMENGSLAATIGAQEHEAGTEAFEAMLNSRRFPSLSRYHMRFQDGRVETRVLNA